MATLNTSLNGPSIAKSYQSIANAGPPSGAAASSPTYGQWAVFSVAAPLVNAFQQDSGGKESTLKVQTTGEGELAELIDEFSDGRVQFAFVKIKDSNTGLPKTALIGWCGEGVPERTKGYFTSHLNAVSRVLHGYHVQITARSDRDLTPEGIVEKIANASGSKYSAGSGEPVSRGGPPPPVSSKPAFMPTQSSSGGGGFNPLSKRAPPSKPSNVDSDGWGEDAPAITRTEVEKVQSAYQPTKVNMRELSSKQEPSRYNAPAQEQDDRDVVKGAYQPVGKVDIAAIRRQAQKSGDDRPAPVKGSYEPVGKVDIAAIRARAQQPSGSAASPPPTVSPAATGSYQQPATSTIGGERLTSLPKPKVANKFGGSSTFTGTKPPAPGGFGLESQSSGPKPPVGVSKTFADEGGKTPAQIWAEKKAKQGGGAPTSSTPSSGPLAAQTSGNEGWKSGYTGKSWASVQTTKTGQSATSVERQATGSRDEPEEESGPRSGGVGAMKEMFKGAPPMGAANTGGAERSAPSPPPLEQSTKPNATRGVPMPGLPSRPAAQEEPAAPRLPTPPPVARSPTPPTPEADSGSPVRIAMPVSNTHVPEVESAREEQFSPPPAMPIRSLAQQADEHDEEPDEPDRGDIGRAAGASVAADTFGHGAADPAPGTQGGKRALIQYDYEKAEDNELQLVEGEYVSNIEMVDEDWWMGTNARGESGLFPSNYVELVDEEDDGGAGAGAAPAPPAVPAQEQAPPAAPAGGASKGATATALYDYEAGEDNELSFPEDATITNIEFPDDDWWSGEYKGQEGLFPANYVQLNQ